MAKKLGSDHTKTLKRPKDKSGQANSLDTINNGSDDSIQL